jgi:hypothetical protein
MSKINRNSLVVGDRALGWLLLVCFVALLVHKPLSKEIGEWVSQSNHTPEQVQGLKRQDRVISAPSCGPFYSRP